VSFCTRVFFKKCDDWIFIYVCLADGFSFILLARYLHLQVARPANNGCRSLCWCEICAFGDAAARTRATFGVLARCIMYTAFCMCALAEDYCAARARPAHCRACNGHSGAPCWKKRTPVAYIIVAVVAFLSDDQPGRKREPTGDGDAALATTAVTQSQVQNVQVDVVMPAFAPTLRTSRVLLQNASFLYIMVEERRKMSFKPPNWPFLCTGI
jgi:hypothetical protein